MPLLDSQDLQSENFFGLLKPKKEIMRDTRLELINRRLAQMGLRSLPGRGDHRKGEIELTRIRWICRWRVNRESAPLFIDVQFDAILPDGSPAWYTIRFNGNSAKGNGVIIVALLKCDGQEPKIALVLLYCPPEARWAVELPRGFPLYDGVSGVESASRLLQREVLALGKITGSARLRNVTELSRTHAVQSEVHLLEVEMPPEGMAALGGTDKNRVQLWTIDQVERDLAAPEGESQINDALSLSALAVALPHIRRHQANITS